MELSRLTEALSQAAACPHDADRVDVRHTHISVVFLAGKYAYKIKKPVNLGLGQKEVNAHQDRPFVASSVMWR